MTNKDYSPLFYNVKIIETPTTIEYWIYEKPLCLRVTKTDSNEEKNRKTFDDMSAIEQGESLKRKQKYYNQKRWDIARIVDCNFDNRTKFVTLTFKQNEQDISYCNIEFMKFIKRLNYYLYKTKIQKIKYLATWEKQKRGAIHYHVIFFDFPYIENEILERIWEHGFIKINKVDVDSKENRGRYISKYFGKDLDIKEHKKKAFFKSRNLKLPTEKKAILTEAIIQDLCQKNVIYEKEYIRKVYDMDSSNSGEYPLKDSNVLYLKVKR